MKKIVIAGAGAYFFAPAILEDLFVRFRMEAEYWMVDADLDMAELSARGAQALARAFGVQARFYYTTQLQKATFSADAVILCSDFLDEEAWKKDFEALDEVGLGKQVRLRGGLGGAMQTLRAVGFVCDLADQMREECPGAPLFERIRRTAPFPRMRGGAALLRRAHPGCERRDGTDPRAAGAVSGLERGQGGRNLRGPERFFVGCVVP